MPAPGSPHALVLAGPSSSTEATPAGERATELLQPFLDASQYTAVAVVHGLGASAPRAFDLAKQRHSRGRGLVWLTDPSLLPELIGDDAAVLKRLLKPSIGFLMTFFSVKNRALSGKLKWFKVNAGEIDREYLEAGLR